MKITKFFALFAALFFAVPFSINAMPQLIEAEKRNENEKLKDDPRLYGLIAAALKYNKVVYDFSDLSYSIKRESQLEAARKNLIGIKIRFAEAKAEYFKQIALVQRQEFARIIEKELSSLKSNLDKIPDLEFAHTEKIILAIFYSESFLGLLEMELSEIVSTAEKK